MATVDVASVQGGSEEMFDYICSSCESRNNKTVEATHYCIDCVDFYCVVCLDIHKFLPVLKTHRVLGRREVKKWGQQKSKSVPTEQCTRHSGKVLEMFCSNHDVLCCTVCVSLEHRLCKGMEHIPELAKGINQSSEIQEVNEKLERVPLEMGRMKTSIQQIKATLDKSRKDILQYIKDMRKLVNKVFDDLEKDATNDTDKHHLDATNSIHGDIKTCDDYLAKLQQVKQNLQTASPDNKSQLFIQVKKCQQQIKEGDQMIQTVSGTARTTSFKFNIDSELERFVTSIQSLGKLEMRTTSLNMEKKQQKIQPYKLQTAREYNVQVKKEEQPCDILGCCQMPDGSILLADSNNKKLKQLNSSYQVTSHCDVPAKPMAVCCIGPQEAAVSDDNQTIHFLSVGRTNILVTRSIKMNHQCCGLVYNNFNLYITDGSDKVYIYNTSGRCLRTLYKDNNGVEMFSRTLNIAVSNDGSKIYVADGHKGLVTLTTDDQLLSIFLDKNLNKACGVSIDSQGSVFVCNHRPPVIIQLDASGTQKLQVTSVGTYLTDYVQSICVDRHNSTLIVTYYGRNSIKVNDLAWRDI